MKIAVADASPLIVLSGAGFLDCLSGLFGGIKVPQSVFDEICAGSSKDTLRFQLSSRPWIEVVHLPQSPTPEVCRRLGRGETEVIEFARLNPSTVALLDDRAARRFAVSLGIPVVGSLGVVTAYYTRERTISFDEAVQRLRRAGLYISVELVDAVRKDLNR
jgi:predicted nucleic acid-binding protein